MQANSYCVALTGGAASGKSTVANMFVQLGVNIIDADTIAKQITNTGSDAFIKIIRHFGEDFLTLNGDLDRKLLRQYIIANVDARLWLEQLLHPLIQTNIQTAITQSNESYTIIEIPLLRQKTNYPYLNRVLWVRAPTEIQCQRLMEREHYSLEEAIAFLKIQIDNETYQAIADDILDTDQPIQSLQQQVYALHTQYLHEC